MLAVPLTYLAKNNKKKLGHWVVRSHGDWLSHFFFILWNSAIWDPDGFLQYVWREINDLAKLLAKQRCKEDLCRLEPCVASIWEGKSQSKAYPCYSPSAGLLSILLAPLFKVKKLYMDWQKECLFNKDINKFYKKIELNLKSNQLMSSGKMND